MLRPIFAICLLAACRDGVVDITGPFTGAVHRYAVNAITLPPDYTQLSDDLDGDGRDDNALGAAFSGLASQSDVNTHVADMIMSGVIASSVEIQADDLVNGQIVGVTFHGADGDDAVVAGASFVNGVLATNRTRDTNHPGSGSAKIPLFADADPLSVHLVGIEMDLLPDGDGYLGAVRGGIPADEVVAAVARGLDQMALASPHDHLQLVDYLDANMDGVISDDEVATNGLTSSLVAPDIHVLGAPALSVAFQIHLIPCATGDCAVVPIASCNDRVLDGDETDVDCGGSCRACPAAAKCTVGPDCQTNACDVGQCRAPTCTDGIQDGFELGRDCGDNCNPCGN